MPIKAADREKIVAQALKEIQFARTYKQGKIKNWQLNEIMYYGRKTTVIESRANVDLGKMQEFVHTLLSKIDNPLVFKFAKRKNSQLKRVNRLNALVAVDRTRDHWDIKDLVGKKQLTIYGRMIFSYFADSIDGFYRPHLNNVDVYDFLIDPAAGGIDVERALNLGSYDVNLSEEELKDGAKAKIYDKNVVAEICEGLGNTNEATQEQTNKQSRTYDQNTTTGQKYLPSKEKYRFWRWCTTYKGDRYYLVLQERSSKAIRVDLLEDVLPPPNKEFPQGAWPYWTAAAFPDLTEFWTPSYCDYVREVFNAQNISINQMLDNAEAVNKPTKIVDVNAIENLAELKYRRDGLVRTKNGADASKAVFTLPVASIETPIQVYNLLEAIHEKASGVTAGSKGLEDPEGKVAIYEGNQEASADRFGLLNKSYSFGYQRFARLYEMGVREHLTKRQAVDMIGPDGIETEEVNKHDIFHKRDEFGLIVEASDAESNASLREKATKLTFLNTQTVDPVIGQLINPKKAFEIKAKIAGLSDDDIKQLLDKSEFGNAELMSECDQDIEGILDGNPDQKLNPGANNAYRQKMLDYMVDHQYDMSQEQFKRFEDYMRKLAPIVVKNEARALNAFAINLMNKGGAPAPVGPDGKPTAPAAPPAPSPAGNGTGAEIPADLSNLTPPQPNGGQ